MLKRLRTYFSRMFLPHLYTPEGFLLIKRQYVSPEDTIQLPPTQKRAITICNLFANQHKRIEDIAKLLDTNRGAVISVLIQEGFIVERRQSPQRSNESSSSEQQPRDDGPMIKAVLMDAAGTNIEEVISPIDPRLPGQPNRLVAQIPAPPNPREKYFF